MNFGVNPEPRPKVAISSLTKVRFLWWRFALIVIVLSLLGWGYSAAWYCYPAPSERQQVVFFLLLLVILIQTIQAGWYRNDEPWEVTYLQAVATVLFAVTLSLMAVTFVAIVMILVPDPLLGVLCILAAGAVAWGVIGLLKKDSGA
jgi:hypothetical protein